ELGFNPTGTITFKLFPPSDPTCGGAAVFTENVTVNGNGMYSTVGSYTTITTGTYRWTAHYSGDTNNAAAASGGAGEPVDIVSALMQITPQSGTNVVGTNHTLTITVNAVPSTATIAAGTATASILTPPSTTGSFVSPPGASCSYAAGVGSSSCVVVITS